MIRGRVCAKHPALNGSRFNDHHCPGCVADWKRANQASIKRTNAKQYAKNAEQSRAAAAKWYRENTERARASRKAWQQENPAKTRATTREQHRKYPERARARKLKQAGFTLESFALAIQLQGGRCAICSKELETLPARGVHADHDHTTGEARGVLCRHCNVGLGLFFDSPERLITAAAYLIKPTLKRRCA